MFLQKLKMLDLNLNRFFCILEEALEVEIQDRQLFDFLKSDVVSISKGRDMIANSCKSKNEYLLEIQHIIKIKKIVMHYQSNYRKNMLHNSEGQYKFVESFKEVNRSYLKKFHNIIDQLYINNNHIALSCSYMLFKNMNYERLLVITDKLQFLCNKMKKVINQMPENHIKKFVILLQNIKLHISRVVSELESFPLVNKSKGSINLYQGFASDMLLFGSSNNDDRDQQIKDEQRNNKQLSKM